MVLCNWISRKQPMVQFSKSNDARLSEAVSAQALIDRAEQRVRLGYAPPPEIYRIEYRRRIDWLNFPGWARPVDPQVFAGCCHEG
jgi:hypothetical protein